VNGDSSLQRRAVLVTGASSGIGLACARRLAGAGYTVFAGARTAEGEARLAGTASVIPVRLDVTDEQSIEHARAAVVQALPPGGLAGVVNNAGVMVSGPLEHVPLAALLRQLEVNVVGVVGVTQRFLPLLRQAGGRIVNIGSTSGRVASPFGGPYCAAKFALEAINTAWREELRSSHVSVHCIDPGVVATPLWSKATEAEEAIHRGLSEDGRRRYGATLERRSGLLRRLARDGASADAVCNAVLHALSSPRPKRRYVVGFDAKVRVAAARLMSDRLRLWVARRTA
jgi:NAD(P)-dependent dehydrogenase (short-subunit alcohol dehydrogenase family)